MFHKFKIKLYNILKLRKSQKELAHFKKFWKERVELNPFSKEYKITIPNVTCSISISNLAHIKYMMKFGTRIMDQNILRKTASLFNLVFNRANS